MNGKNIKIKKFGSSLFSLLTGRSAWCLLALSFLLAIYALVIFGSYAVKIPLESELQNNLQVNKELYQKVFSRLKERDTAIQRGIGQNYPDIFR